jgi:hypothetical protein
MPTFRTAEELSKHYAVTGDRLLSYARRGNLAMRRVGDALQFDEAAVARLFPLRRAYGISISAEHPQPGFGTLGAHRLGELPRAAE